jgi:hypothetical protein
VNRETEIIGVLVRTYWPSSIEDGYRRRKHRFKQIANQYMSTFYDITGVRLYNLQGVDSYRDPDDCHRFEGLFKLPYFTETKYVTK